MKALIRKFVLACFNRVFGTRVSLELVDTVRHVALADLRVSADDIESLKLVVEHGLRFSKDDIQSIRIVSKEELRLSGDAVSSVKLLLKENLRFDLSQVNALKVLLDENLQFTAEDASSIRLLVQQGLKISAADVPSIKLLVRESLYFEPDDLPSIKLVLRHALRLDEENVSNIKLLAREQLRFTERAIPALKLLLGDRLFLDFLTSSEVAAVKLLSATKGLSNSLEAVASLHQLDAIHSLADGYQICYAQEGESLIVDRFFNYRSDGFFVDVGAHHPKRFSNTYALYQRGWRGVNIDPTPGLQALFERDRENDIFLPIAVSNAEAWLDFYLFDEPALNTFSDSLAKEYVELGYKVVEREKVQARRLDTIFSELAISKPIDFLSVDVEDHELQVLESNDWDKYRPKVLLVEILNFDLAKPQDFPVHRLILSVGYVLFAKTCNTLFYKDSV